MRFALALLLALLCTGGQAPAAVTFFSAFAFTTHRFTPGTSSAVPTMVMDFPMQATFSPTQLDETSTANFMGSASAKSSVRHFEGPFLMAVGFANQTGVRQTDLSTQNDMTAAATLEIDFSATFNVVSPGDFPFPRGEVNFPLINYTVASDAGSFVQLEMLNLRWSGSAVRGDFNHTKLISTPSQSGSFSVFDSAPMTPGTIAVGGSAMLSGKLIFTARGVGSESSIFLGADSGSGGATAVPEPSSSLFLLGVLLVGPAAPFSRTRARSA